MTMRQSPIDAPGSWRLTVQQARPGSKEPKQAQAEDGSGKAASAFSNVLREYSDDGEAAPAGPNKAKAQPNAKAQVEEEGKPPAEQGPEGQRQGLKAAGLIARTESKLSQLAQLSKQTPDASGVRAGEKAPESRAAGRHHATHLARVEGGGQQGDAQSSAPDASLESGEHPANVPVEADVEAIPAGTMPANTTVDWASAAETAPSVSVMRGEVTDQPAAGQRGFVVAQEGAPKHHSVGGERRKTGSAEGAKTDPDSSIRQQAAELATSTVLQREAPARTETAHARELHREGERKSSETLGRTLEHVVTDTAHETHEVGQSQFDKHINIRVLKQEVHHPVMANPSSILHRIESQLRDAMRNWGLGRTSGAAAAAAADAGTSAQGPLRILQIQLSPAALGNVTVKIGLQDGAVRVQMEAETPQVVHALRHDQAALVSMLRSAGLSVDPGSVDVTQAMQHGQTHMGTSTGGEGAAASAQGGGGDARDSGARGERSRDGRGVEEMEDLTVRNEDDAGQSLQDGLRSGARYI